MCETSLITENLRQAPEQETSPQNLLSLQRVDLICPYIQNSGLEELEAVFRALATRDPPVEVRVLTTSQFGFTQPEAIHKLSSLPAVKVRLFIPNSPTLHAKGWLFIYDNQTSVSFVGSSNMSKSAVSTGFELSIRTTEKQIAHDFQSFFESFWFERNNVLQYGSEDCDWERLCELILSEVNPRCSDINSKCKHPECVKLRRKHQGILEKFQSRKKGTGKRPRPPESPWGFSPNSQPNRQKTERNLIRQKKNISFQDAVALDDFKDISNVPDKFRRRPAFPSTRLNLMPNLATSFISIMSSIHIYTVAEEDFLHAVDCIDFFLSRSYQSDCWTSCQ